MAVIGLIGRLKAAFMCTCTLFQEERGKMISRRTFVQSAAPSSAALVGPAVARAQSSPPYRIVYDDFRDGFAAANQFTGTGPKWYYFGAGPFLGNDAIAETSRYRGLSVRASGSNPRTGRPAFSLTLGQEGSAENPLALPGAVDHVKWLVYANHTATSGFPGFDAVAGQQLNLEAWISGETYGTAGHPFGSAVTDPGDDLRLAAFAFNTIDFETFMVFDFFITNRHVYAFYERLPFGRGPQLGNYAAFSFAVRAAAREPEDQHHLRIAYNRSLGRVSWYVDGGLALEVNRIGRRIDRRYMTLDHGGEEVTVSPRQLCNGMGLFTLLDAYLPSKRSLVRLSNSPGFYFNPEMGPPAEAAFVDGQSMRGSRLFGQGASLRMRRTVISSVRPE